MVHLLHNLSGIVELLHHLDRLLYWLTRQSGLLLLLHNLRHHLLTRLLTGLLVGDQLTQSSAGHCDGP